MTVGGSGRASLVSNFDLQIHRFTYPKGILIQVLSPLNSFLYAFCVRIHEQVAKNLVYTLAGGSTCMIVCLLVM